MTILMFPLAFIISCLSYASGVDSLLIVSMSGLTVVFCLAALSNKRVLWTTYYLFLCTLYFWIGYSGWYGSSPSEEYILHGRMLIGLIQTLPFFAAAIYFVAYPRVTRTLSSFWRAIAAFFVYILVINKFHFDLYTVAQVRNFLGIFVAYLVGTYCGIFLDIKRFYRGILAVALVVSVFGVFEYLYGIEYWQRYFPSALVSELKSAGTSDNGVIGNKTIGINHKPYYRLSSFFYSPPHAAYNFVFYTLFFFVYLSCDGYFKKVHPWRGSSLVCVFFFLLAFLTLIKAGWGQFIIARSLYIVLSRKVLMKNLREASMLKIVLLLIAALGLGSFGMWLYIASGVVSTGRAHLQATLEVFSFPARRILFGSDHPGFDVLNSDSGFATIVYSIGIVGYGMFVCLFAMMIKHFLSNEHNGNVGVMIASLVLGWFAVLHLTSSAWSPMGNFILFFSAGVFSHARTKRFSVGRERAGCGECRINYGNSPV